MTPSAFASDRPVAVADSTTLQETAAEIQDCTALEDGSFKTTSSTISTSMDSISLDLEDVIEENTRRHHRKDKQSPVRATREVAESSLLQHAEVDLIGKESTLGRYNPVVSNLYQTIGDIYLRQKNHSSKAVIMLRASYRIDTILYGAATNGCFPKHFRQALTARGVAEGDFPMIQEHLEESTRLELNGDALRRLGMAERAAKEYQKAIKVEEAAFGRENPCLAILWRKMACLVILIRSGRSSWMGEIDDMDRLDGKWFNQRGMKDNPQSGRKEERSSSAFIHPRLLRIMQEGDVYFKSFLYNQAVSKYSHATTVNVGRRSRSRSTSSSKCCSSRSRSNSRSCSRDGSKSPRRGVRQSKPRHQPSPISPETPLEELQAFLKEPSKVHAVQERKASKSDEVPVKSIIKSENASEIKPIVGTDDYNNDSSISPEKEKTHQTIISTSKRAKKGNTNSSSRSIYQAIIHCVDPQRPKSDSHVANLAKKVAKTTSQQIRNAIGSGSLHKKSCHSVATSSHGDSFVSIEKVELRPKSDSSYAVLASPPMTPLIDNTTVKLNGLLGEGSQRGIPEVFADDHPLSAPSRQH